MKKILALFLLTGASPLFGQEWPTNFFLSKLKWGMKAENVVATYPELAKRANKFYFNGVNEQAGYFTVQFTFYPGKLPGDASTYRPGVLEGVGINYTWFYPPSLPELESASTLEKIFWTGPYLPVLARQYGKLFEKFSRDYGHPDTEEAKSDRGVSQAFWRKPHLTANLGFQRGDNANGDIKNGKRSLLAVQFSNPNIRDDVQELSRAREYWSFKLMEEPK